MGRYYFSKKTKAEDCHSITIGFLKGNGYLKPNTWQSGGVKWSFMGSETGNVNFQVSTTEKNIRFQYKTRDRYSEEEWNHKDYQIQLVTTKCNLGGSRYWFKCKFCLKRAGVLYLEGNNDFACRTCLNLTYTSKRHSKRLRWLGKLFKYDEIQEKIFNLRTKYYKGKATRRHKVYMAQMRRLNY